MDAIPLSRLHFQDLPSMHRRSGFTLIELLVAVGVIALLLVITFPAFVAIRKSQKIKRAEAVVETLTTAVASYANDFGIYPPAEFAPEGPDRGNRSLVTLLDARGGRSYPYLPSAFYDQHTAALKGPLILDPWERPYIYFDTSVMRDDTSHTYTLLGDPNVTPIKNEDGFLNVGRCQIWSCGPNQQSDGGLNLHTKEADDLANFETQKTE